MKRPRERMILLVALLTLAIFSFTPGLARYRSLALITPYDWFYQASSVPSEVGVAARIRLQGSGLYPRMITFNADEGMSTWLDAEVGFTVDFTFADFPPFGSHSRFYDPDDELYGAYLGSYYVHGLGKELTPTQVAKVAEFDQRALALPALGLGFADSHFETTMGSTSTNSFAGAQWTTYDASVRTNCPDHSPDGFRAAYLQFGWPPPTDQQFPDCELAARIEVTYLAEHDLNIGLYIMAPSTATVERLSEQVTRQVELG